MSMQADKSLRIQFAPYFADVHNHPRQLVPLVSAAAERAKYMNSPDDGGQWILAEFASTEARDAFKENPPHQLGGAGFTIEPQGFFDQWAPE